MNDTTHNGKIARLPRNIRDELNHRLDDGEPGGPILEWLNNLPQVKHVLVKDFGGGRINAQNLSNRRKDGFQIWLKQQERRNLVRELTENAEELTTDAGGVEVGNHLSALLVADFGTSARDALAVIIDPAERCVRQQEYLQTLARVRRQDYLAGRLAIERERRARERVKEKKKDDYQKECARDSWAFVLGMKRSSMTDSFAKPDFISQAFATQEAESLLRGLDLDPSGPARSVSLDKPKSN
jgi:hypothetical protein